MYEPVISGAPTASAKARSHQPGMNTMPTSVTAGAIPSASEGQNRRP